MKTKVSEKDWRALLGLKTTSTSKRRKKTAAYSHGLLTSDGDMDTVIEKTGPGHNDSESSDTVIEKKRDSDSESRDSVNEQTAERFSCDSRSMKSQKRDSINNKRRITEIRDSLGLKEPKISKRKHSTPKSEPKDTLWFYRKRLVFLKPSRVLVDGPVLFFIMVNGLSMKDVKKVLKDKKAQFLTTSCVLREMELFYQKHSGCAQMLESIKKAKAFELVPCMHKKKVSAEQCVRSVVSIRNSRKLFVAVVANCSWPLVQKDPTIPIIIAENTTFGLKQLSSREQKLAKKWCADYPIEKATITNKDLKASLHFRRLRSRIKFYGCVGKVSVKEGGDSQFKVISELLLPLVVPCETVRDNVVTQLLSYPKLYQDFVELEGPEDDVDLAYLEYVNSVSRDGEWGDEYTMQAAADFYQVMFVVITSLEGCAVNEFLPHDMVNVDPEKALYLSCLYENDEKHYNILHRKSTIASTCRFAYT